MSARGARTPRRGADARGPGPSDSAPRIPLGHPAFLLALVACAASLVLSASYRLYDTDLWTLLTTGRAIWEHGIPRVDLWSWPRYGAPEVMSSWLFRWRLWPVWERGVVALFVWRWLVVLATFAFAWLAARRMGARGVLALPILAWCGLVYRLRTDLRPEILAGTLFALTLWILETARQRGLHRPRGENAAAAAMAPPPAWRRLVADPRGWLVPIACLWVNAHVSWYLLFALWALYLIDGRGGRPWRLVALALAACLVNPWGWRLPWQPIEYALFWRGEPLFRAIGELQPLDWSAHVRDGLPLLLVLWAALAMRRWRARGFDVVEIAGGVAFTAAAISSQRFLGTLALFAAPFLARDASEAAAGWKPAALGSPWARGVLAAAACLGLGVAEWRRPDLPLGVALDTRGLPVAACDFVARHGVRGRAMNDLHLGGYLLWRFWPERERLPFLTTQPENASRADRDGYAAALTDENGWRSLEARREFEWVLLDRHPSPGERLFDAVAADPRFVPVFMDDAAIVFVRSEGRLAAVADSFAYRVVPADLERRKELIAACERDSTIRALATREFARQSAESPENSISEQALGALALMDGRPEVARPHLERALRVDPASTGARRLLEAASGSR